ncbi:MAG TPA: ABC transporter substrate-binding protein [Stellaceae bacterium]|nr:ABC transporter substrate-binding protein [Stellaceae bacterium]
MSTCLNFSRRQFLTAAGAAALGGAMSHRAQAQDRLKVSLITTQGTAGLVVLDIAVSEGFIAEQGIDPTFISVSDASKAIAALIGRNSDMCLWSGPGGVLAAIEKGATLKILAGSLLFPTHAIYSAKPDIHRVADLVGRTIGIGALGSQLHQEMLAILRKKGVDTARVVFRNVGSSTDVFRAVVAGTVDAGPAEVDVFDQQSKYKVHALEDGDLWTEVPELVFQAAYATDQAIAEKRPALVHTLAAFCKTYRYISSPASQDSWVRSYLKIAGKDKQDAAISQWRFIQKYQPYAKDLVLSPQQIQFMQQLNVEMGVQKHIVPDERTIDMSLARDAVALLG